MVSYDDPQALKDYVESHDVRFSMLSDVESRVIRDYGILNTAISPGHFSYGVPYPGTYVADESGVITAKFFYDSYKRRENPHAIIDAALGRVDLSEDLPGAKGGDEGARIRVGFQGGPIKQGAQRRVIVRFELADGFIVYRDPAPAELISVKIGVTGPEGLVVEQANYPPTETRRMSDPNVEVEGWTGVVDVLIPVYAQSRLASELRELEDTELELFVKVRYQACNETGCLPPRTEDFRLTVPIEPIDVPNLSVFAGRGQKTVGMRSKAHLFRLLWRALRKDPLQFLARIMRYR